ncbi:MAG: SPOCS domain-containing protein [Oscillospiraceae bacterium]
MNLDLKSEKISYMKPVFQHRFTREESIEVIVPDALPDILRLIDTDGTPLLRSKDSDAGRVTISGIAEMTALYVPESGGGLQKLEVNLPFSASSDGADITSDSLITAQVTLISADSRTINPRKIIIRAEICCEVACYSPLTIYCGVPRETTDIFVRPESAVMRLPSAVNENTFIFTDELKMPSGSYSIGDILKTSVRLKCEDVKPVGSKAVIKGSAFTDIAYSARDTGTLQRASFVTPFSQIVESDSSEEAQDFRVYPMLTGAYVSRDYLEDGGGEALSLEVHAVAQCVSYSDFTVNYLSDAYSTKYDINMSTAGIVFDCLSGKESASETIKGNIPTAGTTGEINLVSLRPGPVTATMQDGKTVLSANITASVVYTSTDGSILSSSKRLELRHELESETASGTAAELTCGEPFAAVSDSGIELRIPAELSISKFSKQTIGLIESIDYDEERLKDISALASLVVIRAGDRTDLWSLAKRYSSSIESITAINNISENDGIASGTVLIIPKNR